MNYTKDFIDYVNIIKNTFSGKYSLKIEKYGILYII